MKHPFVMWACGHAHQKDREGRVITCRPKPAWYLLQVGNPKNYRFTNGLQIGDYTLHCLDPDGNTYSPAQSLPDTVALRLADAARRRLMLWSAERGCWFPVMP